MMQTPEVKTNNEGIKTLVEAINKPIQKAIKKRQDNFKNQSAVAQSKEIMKASGKQQRKTIKTAAKAEGKQARKNMRVTAEIAGPSKPGTRKTVTSGSMSISQTTAGGTRTARPAARRTTTTPKAAPKTATSSAKITKASATNTKPKIPAASVKARKMK
jgi:hypothetical protein